MLESLAVGLVMWHGWRKMKCIQGFVGGNVKKPLVNLRSKGKCNIKMYCKKRRDEKTLNASM